MKSKHSTWKCRKCRKKYVPAKKVYGGFIYECDQCSFESQGEEIDRKVGRTDRYVGRMTEKGNEGIIIFRTDIASHKAQLKLEAGRGMSPNLNISSPVGQLIRQGKEEGRAVDREAGETINDWIKEPEMKLTTRLQRDIQHLDIANRMYHKNEFTFEEYLSEVRQLVINMLLAIDQKIEPEELYPAKDIEYRVKEGN